MTIETSRRSNIIRLRKFARGSKQCSDRSLDSTITAVDSCFHQRCDDKVSEARRGVRFQEKRNQVHVVETADSSQLQELWYSQEELASIRKALSFQVKLVMRETQDEHEQWYRCLSEAYNCFANAESPDDINKVIDSSLLVIDDMSHLIGLETFCIRSVQEHKMRKRKDLVKMICSKGRGRSNSFPRKACRNVSRSSRLFAHFIALLSAGNDFA